MFNSRVDSLQAEWQIKIKAAPDEATFILFTCALTVVLQTEYSFAHCWFLQLTHVLLASV